MFSKSSEVKKLKETVVYKKFEKGLKGKNLYHGGTNIINKSPGINNEQHLTWFWVDDVNGAIAHIESSDSNLPIYEVDFNNIAKDHLVFPDLEYIPYTIIKKAVDKVYPKDKIPLAVDKSGKPTSCAKRHSKFPDIKRFNNTSLVFFLL
jgi:hypothetical protein